MTAEATGPTAWSWRQPLAGIPMLRSIRVRLAGAFAMLFVVLVGGIPSVELWGLPVGGFEGTQSMNRSVAFDPIEQTADLQKERLLRSLEERRDDTRVTAENPFTTTAVAGITADVAGLAAAGVPAVEIGALLRGNPDVLRLSQYLEQIQVAYGVYDQIAPSGQPPGDTRGGGRRQGTLAGSNLPGY